MRRAICNATVFSLITFCWSVPGLAEESVATEPVAAALESAAEAEPVAEENEYVLEKLVLGLSSLSKDYQIAHADTGDGRGIDVAFLYDNSKFKLEETFQHWVVKRSATRELFQANMKVRENDSDLVLIGNHWPARSAGTYISEPYRMLAGETLSYWMSRLNEA